MTLGTRQFKSLKANLPPNPGHQADGWRHRLCPVPLSAIGGYSESPSRCRIADNLLTAGVHLFSCGSVTNASPFGSVFYRGTVEV